MNRIIILAIFFLMCIVSINAQECSKNNLIKIVKLYYEAQKSGKPKLLPIKDSTVFKENKEQVSIADSIISNALPITFSRDFYDLNTCTILSEVVVDDEYNPSVYVMNIRIQVIDNIISEINAIVTTEGDWEFDAQGFLKTAKKEDWAKLDKEKLLNRDELIKAADAYMDYFTYENIKVPWGNPCAHLEGGKKYSGDNKNPSCKVGFTLDVFDNVEREYFVDEEHGVVNIFCRFAKTDSTSQFGESPGKPDSHTFRIVDGKIRYIHSLTVLDPVEVEKVGEILTNKMKNKK